MIYLNVRHTVADYEKWRSFFDGDKSRRKAGGATGEEQVYCDANNPNIVTTLMAWDTMENAWKFANDPKLAEVMKQAGVIGRPELIAVLKPA